MGNDWEITLRCFLKKKKKAQADVVLHIFTVGVATLKVLSQNVWKLV